MTAVVILLGVGLGYWYWSDNRPKSASETPLVETAENAANNLDSGTQTAPADNNADIAIRSIVFDNVEQLRQADGNTITKTDDGLLLRSSLTSAGSGGVTGAPSYFLDREFDAAAVGKTVRVTAVARSADVDGSPPFSMAYSTAAIGNSGWQRFELGGTFAEYSFDYKIAQSDRPVYGDFLGLWADGSGNDLGVIVQSIKVEIVE